MSIIYMNIEAWKSIKSKTIDVQGDSDEELAKNVVNEFKRRNNYVNEGTLVCRYKDIMPIILKQYQNRNSFQGEYWLENATDGCLVYCVVEDVVISYDYFLYTYGYLDETDSAFYRQVRGVNTDIPTCLKLQLIFGDKHIQKKITNRMLISDVAKIENMCYSRTLSTDWKLDEMVFDRINKQLFTGQYSIKKELKNRLGIDFNRFKDSQKEDCFRMMFWMYYMDRLGLPQKNGDFAKLGVLDTMKKPRIYVISDYRVHKGEVDAACHMNMFKNIIVRYIEYKRIVEIQRVTKRVNDWYTRIFDYIARVMVEETDTTKKLREFENITSRLDYAKQIVDSVKEAEKKRGYEMTVWELMYLRYIRFIDKCRKEDSKISLQFVLDMDEPQNIKFYDTCVDEELRLANVPMVNLRKYICKKAECIARHVNENCDREWIEKNIDRIIKYNEIVFGFDRRNESRNCPTTMIFAMYQVIYELESNKLKYDSNYKKYKGNKKKSILAQLDSSARNSETEAFGYVLIALLKKWFHYNENNSDLWLALANANLKFQEITDIILNFDSIIDIEAVIEGLHVEFAIPQKGFCLEIKEKREQEFFEKTGYALDIQDMV